jgi:uracil-DNA glycosylase
VIKVPKDKWPLKFWDSGEWQAIEERIEERISKGYVINPRTDCLFRALELTPFDKCTVCILGQDPYPEPSYATGVAFSVPTSVTRLPPTLVTFFTEYSKDLGLEFPSSGNLERWCQDGVLLWNAVPTCEAYRSLSHHDWSEWHFLTDEIVQSLSTKGIVFVALGSVARTYVSKIRDVTDTLHTYNNKRLGTKGYVSKGIVTVDNERRLDNTIIEVSHPSPRASRASRNPFLGSRMFSRVNDCLCQKGYQPIQWSL